MSMRHLVDREVAPLIDLFDAPAFTRDNLAEARALSDARFALLPPPPLTPSRHVVPGFDGTADVPVLVYQRQAEGTGRPCVLYLHGGGMIMGSAEMAGLAWAARAADSDLVVVSVEYRLAPEHPFPAAHEDCYAALAWAIANADELGIDPQRVALAGDSAGGYLAAAVALMARDRGELHPAAQIMTYPMLDHRTGGPDDVHRNPTTGEFMWSRDRNRFAWDCLRGDYRLDDERIGWFSPARARDLAGLPPALIATGSLDLFFDENLDYARRLCAAGVPVELHSYPGAIHAFTAMPEAAIAKACRRDVWEGTKRLLQIA